ncbi:hypothetical protein [Paraburkholderia azotifigens]|uniref:DUF4398 domain-containing protein n=1 Tax=Paraburkholderia azotifigens TaxID=2057004 RepID=A0A5C6VJC8_9BURK|nr:hypothetical protein [Paraburkholderia azotifigens]TXC82238.1 hypothetical protein FRZ40_17225 [Paraburkholderia azotifigens]TXC84771.1 hypothetical protein FRZ40_31650 [Paraburkholderia azotifigens]
MHSKHIATIAAAACVLSFVCGCAVAHEGYFLSRHPIIAAADFDSQQAIEQMRAAQRANSDDMGGHAGRAIQLLQDARQEMQAAAGAAH